MHYAEADDDVAEHAVIHIHDTVPYDATRIDAEYISLLDVVIHHSSEKVVCSSDRMEIAREMKIDIFHRNDLRIAAAGSTALDAHAWASRAVANGLPAGVGEIAVTRISLPFGFSSSSLVNFRETFAL